MQTTFATKNSKTAKTTIAYLSVKNKSIAYCPISRYVVADDGAAYHDFEIASICQKFDSLDDRADALPMVEITINGKTDGIPALLTALAQVTGLG